MARKKYKIPNWKHNPNNTTKKDMSFIQIYHDLLINKTFLKLNNSSKVLYFYMYDYSNGSQEFEFPYSIYSKIMTKNTFQSCIKELSENGFIEVIENGKSTRTPNKYKFINKWYLS